MIVRTFRCQDDVVLHTVILNNLKQVLLQLPGHITIFTKIVQLIFNVLQSVDLEGEIDLTSCVNVSDYDVEKNYGLQIQVCIYCTVMLTVLFHSLRYTVQIEIRQPRPHT